MPEGHVIHRLAGAINDAFADERPHVWSPQGRFTESAAVVDGQVLLGADAWGKHLFVAFDAPAPESVIQIHLGLIGKLRVGAIEPVKGQIRLRIDDGVIAADLRGPQMCRLITPDQAGRAVADLGPDPLRADADPERGWARVHRSSKPIAALLMDQRITAGVGNIYRAEVLFRHRIDPFCPGSMLKRSSWDAIWAELVVLMAAGIADGRIDTVTEEHTPEVMGRDPRVDRHGGEVYVYRRADLPCWVCGSRVRTELLEGRNLYWCGRCQRRH